uniref:Uncharacterized protein n=1 Tax=Rhizophora mucronata TaxID=61149 RepID=A0A2P2IKV7_RHIMU
MFQFRSHGYLLTSHKKKYSIFQSRCNLICTSLTYSQKLYRERQTKRQTTRLS